MTTPGFEDRTGQAPETGSTSTHASPALSKGTLRIVTDDPEELARYAQAQQAAREQGVGAAPLDAAFSVPAMPSAIEPVRLSDYTASLPAFLNTDRVRNQVSRRVPDSAWREYAPVDPSLTTADEGYGYISARDDADERLLDEMDFSQGHAERDERREDRRRRAAALAAHEAAKRSRSRAARTRGQAVAGASPAASPLSARQRKEALSSLPDPSAPMGPVGAEAGRLRPPVQHANPLAGSQSGSSKPKAAPSPSRGLSADAAQAARRSSAGAPSPASAQSPDAPAPAPSKPASGRAARSLAERAAAAIVTPAGAARSKAASDPDLIWRAAVVWITVAASIFACIAMLYFPAQKLYLAIRENERLVDELGQNYLRNDQIQRRVDYLQTEAGIQDEAHSVYDYVMPGENSVKVLGVDVENPYAGSDTIGGIERGSGRNTHSVATDILDRVFGTGADRRDVPIVTEKPGKAADDASGGDVVNPDADIVAQ